MLPYWLLFTAFCAGALQAQRRERLGLQPRPLLIVAGLATGLMIGLRYRVGGDWGSYQDIFDSVRYYDLDQVLSLGDPGYMLLNWIGSELGVEVWFVNAVCGLVFAWGLIKFSRRQPNPWLAMVVAIPYLVIVVAMGYSRQGVAIGLIMAAMAAERQSLVRLTIYIIIAATFHKTAVVVLPLVGLSMERNRVMNGFLLLVSGFFLYRFFLSASVDTLVTNYIDQQYSSQGAAIRVSMNLVPATLFLLYGRRFGLEEDQRKLWRNFSLVAWGLLGLLLVLPSSTVVDRLALYIIPLQLFVLSRLPEAFPTQGRRNGQLVLLVIIYSAIVQYTWLNYASNAVAWLPYRLYPLFSEVRE
jgi:hypothetical protein